MSLKRARYIHFQTHKDGRYQGFTAEVAPVVIPLGDGRESDTCLFRITFCNVKDQFSRKLGRSYVSQVPWREVRVVDVPKELAKATWECHGRHYGDPVALEKASLRVQRYEHNQWAWVWKYFL